MGKRGGGVVIKRIPAALKIALLAVAATGFYTYVGQLVPQKRVEAPVVLELPKDLTPDQMAEVGRTIFEGKGLCSTCHTRGKSGALRFPDMAGIASRAGTRVPGLSALQYMTHSIYRPEEYIVPGFNPGMPTINRPPIGLTDDEIKTVIAYLQTLGGEATITMDTVLPIPGREVAAAEAPAEAAGEQAAAEGAAPSAGQTPLERFQCGSCHYLDQPGRLKAASLQGIGSRMDRNAILAGILSSHRNEGFYKQATIDELRQIVDSLAQGGTQ